MRRCAGLAAAGVLAVAGCGGSSTSRTTGAGVGGAAGPTAGSVALPGLGSLSYRCSRARAVQAALAPASATATEQVSVEGEGGHHLRAATLNPDSARLAVPPGRYATLTWRVIQSTEAKTVVETVRLTFNGASGCAAVARQSTVRSISHVGYWAPPSLWP